MVSAKLAFGEPNTSLWHYSVDTPLPAAPPASLPRSVDIAIIGAGFTGLWTAYYLAKAAPQLRIAIFEANHVAFGASGRNGGWALGSLDGQHLYVRGLDAAAMRAAAGCITDAVDEIGRVAGTEQISCGYHKGGVLRIAARFPEQREELATHTALIEAEMGAKDYDVLDANQLAAVARVRAPIGAVFQSQCAVLNPARLAHGLADAVRRMGVDIHQRCSVRSFAAGRITTEYGIVNAGAIVPAAEAYSGSLPPLMGRVVPIYSHVIATAPLSDRQRTAIGLADRQAFSDCSGIHTYGQITEDGRLVFGALASYPWAAKPGTLPQPHFERMYAFIRRVLLDLLPQLDGVDITHRWSGALGLPRAFRPNVIADRSRGVYWGGGYLGRGVAASNLFGHTLAELITGTDTARTRCPWVLRDARIEDALRVWEPEPVKWLGATSHIWPGKAAETVLMSRTVPKTIKRLVFGATRAFAKAIS